MLFDKSSFQKSYDRHGRGGRGSDGSKGFGLAVEPLDHRVSVLEEQRRILQDALGDYELVQPIQRGGQGLVYLARQKKPTRMVALKVLLDGPLATDRQRYRFEREIELVARLNHPNIVSLYESGVVRGRHFFTMEYVDGLSIDDFVILHDLRPREIVRLVIQVCGAVSYAHQNGVIHRDLNPANILIDDRGEPHIFDFGLAADLDGSHRNADYSQTGQIIGTLPYLSPEQAGGLDGKTDVRSDVYALGVILYHLLTDTFPYDVGQEPQAIRNVIISADPIPLRAAFAQSDVDRSPGTGEISRDLELIISKALAKQKTERYQAVASLADDLRHYCDGEAISAHAPTAFYLLRKQVRKHRVAASVVGTALVSITVASIALTFAWLDAGRQRDTARQAAQMAYDAFELALRDVEELVRPLPGGLAVRNHLLKKLENDFPRLETFAAADERLLPIASRLHEKRGDIAADQGRRMDARNHYQAFLDQSLRITQSPAPSGEAVDQVVRAYRKLAEMSDQPAPIYERAITAGDKAIAGAPDRADARYNQARNHLAYGQYLKDAGDYKRALGHFERAIDLVPHASESEGQLRWDRLTATALSGQGRILLDLGRSEEGIAAIESGLQLREQIVKRRPIDVDARRALVFSYKHAGLLKRSAGDASDAKALLLRGISEADRLAEMDPSAVDWDRERFTLQYDLAVLCLETGQLDEALQRCAIAVTLVNRLLAADSGDSEASAQLAYLLILRGRAYFANSAWTDARHAFEQALSLREALLATNPENLVRRQEVAGAVYWMGATIRRANSAQDGLNFYRRSHTIFSEISAEHPNVTKCALDLIDSSTSLAAVCIACKTSKENAEAKALLSQAERSLRDLQASGTFAGVEGEYERRIRAIRANVRILDTRQSIE